MEDLIANAVELMILGMGTVFVFLAILVIAMGILSSLASKVAPAAPPAPPKRSSRRPATATNLDPRMRTAIELAVARYRKEH